MSLLYKICLTYPSNMKLGTVLPYLKKIHRRCQSRDTPLEFYWHWHFVTFWFLSFFNFSWILLNIVTNLMMPAKMASLDLLQIKLFWNNRYDAIISVYNVTNKILSRDWNYIAGVIIWPKFGNSVISMREIIIISVW